MLNCIQSSTTSINLQKILLILFLSSLVGQLATKPWVNLIKPLGQNLFYKMTSYKTNLAFLGWLNWLLVYSQIHRSKFQTQWGKEFLLTVVQIYWTFYNIPLWVPTWTILSRIYPLPVMQSLVVISWWNKYHVLSYHN